MTIRVLILFFICSHSASGSFDEAQSFEAQVYKELLTFHKEEDIKSPQKMLSTFFSMKDCTTWMWKALSAFQNLHEDNPEQSLEHDALKHVCNAFERKVQNSDLATSYSVAVASNNNKDQLEIFLEPEDLEDILRERKLLGETIYKKYGAYQLDFPEFFEEAARFAFEHALTYVHRKFLNRIGSIVRHSYKTFMSQGLCVAYPFRNLEDWNEFRGVWFDCMEESSRLYINAWLSLFDRLMVLFAERSRIRLLLSGFDDDASEIYLPRDVGFIVLELFCKKLLPRDFIDPYANLDRFNPRKKRTVCTIQ